MHVHLRRLLTAMGAVGVLAAAGLVFVPRLYQARLPRAGEIVTLYTACGHQLPGGKAPPELLSRFAGRRSGTRLGSWLLVGSMGRRMRLARLVDLLCPVCRRARFLGLDQGMVVAFEGTPAHRGRVVEQTEIPAAALPAEERNDLTRGLPFADDKVKMQILEGLAALINE